MKPFDLEAAKRGEPIVTRGGEAAKFIAHVPEANACYQVVALFSGLISTYAASGHVYSEKTPYDADLFMAPRKRTVWVNVYPPEARNFGGSYETEAIANNYASPKRIGNRAWPLEIED